MEKTMKTAIKKKPGRKTQKPNSNLKATFGLLKGRISEAADLWDEDLKKTIPDNPK
jgi:hypothetical protein